MHALNTWQALTRWRLALVLGCGMTLIVGGGWQASTAAVGPAGEEENRHRIALTIEEIRAFTRRAYDVTTGIDDGATSAPHLTAGEIRFLDQNLFLPNGISDRPPATSAPLVPTCGDNFPRRFPGE